MSKLIVANWKMNGSILQIQADLTAYIESPITNQANVVLAVPDIYLYQASQIIKQSGAKLSLACQNISQFNSVGAYTGEISATLLKEFAVRYAIIGHSERRTFLHESGHILLNKVENALLNDIIPIFCVGEDKSRRDEGSYLEFLKHQLELLCDVKTKVEQMVIAYEPIWAIGTGVVPTNQQISEVTKLIYAFVQNYLPHAKITVLYGGSVNGKNAHEILSPDEVGGVLVGGASLKVNDFTQICKE